jgi:hypothetical protein
MVSTLPTPLNQPMIRPVHHSTDMYAWRGTRSIPLYRVQLHSAHPSLVNLISRPSCLLFSVHLPSHLKVTYCLGPSVSIAAPFTTDNIFLYHLLYHMPPAHPSLSGTTILGPPISILYGTSAEPSQSYTLPRPIRLHRCSIHY